ncbi:hypothetical protein PPERSA_04111 [Pseudocohnilembus persalinus]|uniref:Transmembrane protein n=1 Tax=Pseudocohnilembus persalinus TaxID=266149 RepID=A0A0V0QN23_PSEPJ|nr:hypothetical protein PPERSA_04111 [Pseudocohnilembus persalinus]|eukprot:KRX03559.1 hypothetical protein PPERSA_04111 [Pseudocohnilembus persalinus]
MRINIYKQKNKQIIFFHSNSIFLTTPLLFLFFFLFTISKCFHQKFFQYQLFWIQFLQLFYFFQKLVPICLFYLEKSFFQFFEQLLLLLLNLPYLKLILQKQI